jgi:hypothetical protein
MSIDKLFLIGLGLFLGILVILQVYIRYRICKISQQTGQGLSKAAETRLTPKQNFRLGLFHILFQLYVIIGSLYYIWVGKFSVLLGLAFIVVALVFVRNPIKLVRDNRPVHAEFSLVVPQLDRIRSSVTPEFIAEILSEDSVMNIIKADLAKTRQIGYKEQWRLGLLTPDIDRCDLSYNLLSRRERLSKFADPVTMSNLADQIPIKRAAILNPTTYFSVQPNRIMIVHGTVKPMIQQYPGWTHRLIGETPRHGYKSIRELEIDTDSPSARNRSQSLSRFLQEDGFPLKEYYPDGDPLTTERGGTIVVDGEDIRVIYPNHFVQRRLIDDLGNLVYLGLDENFGYSSTWNGVSVVPSVSKKLYKCVTYNEYIPIVRFRSFPYASDAMLPILDTPMSDSGWSDLFIDTRGKARLYMAKEKTLNEWYEMMGRLRQLFFGELAKTGYHLLGLTKDQMHLHEYFLKKQRILRDYFIIQDWWLS